MARCRGGVLTEDDGGWPAQDVRVVEASPEQEEEQVERERPDDQKGVGGVLNGHRVASGFRLSEQHSEEEPGQQSEGY